MRTYLLLALLILGVGCGRDGAFEDIDTSTPIVSDIPDGRPMVYPQVYLDNDLPEYTGAILTNVGGQPASLKDGFKITAVSNDSMRLIMPFYIEAMEKLGYTYDKSKYEEDNLLEEPPMMTVVFQKEKRKFSVTLMKMQEQQTEIKIDFMEN